MEEDNITPDVVEDVAPPQEPVQEPVQEPAQEPENVYDRADMFGRNIRLDFGDPAEQRGQRRLTTEAEQNYEARRDYINSEVHGLGSFVDRVVISDNMLHEAAVAIMEDTPKRDESFKWTGDSWGKAIQDVPEDFHHEIREAESWAEAEKIKADIQYRLKIEEGLAEYGGWGTVGRMGLAMTDPIFLAAMLATEGAVGATLGSAIIRSSTARSIVAKASELSIGQQAAYKTVAHIAKTGARVGVGMGGATAVHAGLSPMIDLDDVPTAMLHGAMFGGVLGIAGRTFSPLVRRYRVPSKTYQMTTAQFERRAGKGKVSGTHLEAVEQAFKDGNKKIPEHVMMEYPELVAKYVGEKEATALRHAKAALDLRGYKGKQPMDPVEYLADLRDPLAPTGPSLASRISRRFKLRDAEGKFKQAEVEFKDAKKAYEDTIGEPWEKVEPFLERQRAAEVKLKEARRLGVQGKKLTALEKELNTATKEARLQGEKGGRALDVARKRQSRKMMEVKGKRDAAQKEVAAAKEKYVEVINEPRAKLTEKYNKQLKENLIADIAAGKPIPAKALEHFPELRKMEGVKTYAEAKKAAEAKDEMNLSEESIKDIDKTIPDEALKPIEPIEPPLDPEIQALKDKLLGPSYVEQTVKSIENALAERGLPKSKKVDGKMENKQQKLDRLEAHDTAVLFDNYRDMQKLIKNLKKQGFKPTNKNRGKADLVEQLKEFREQVKNPPKEKVIPKMEATKPKSYTEALDKTREAYAEQGKNVDLQVSAVTEAEAQAILDEGGTLLLTEDGMMGGYVTADGYMGGIFSHPESSGGAVKGFMAEMERLGGTHGESYATYLEPLYAALGWKPVARIKFNVEYAPKGWDAPDSVLRNKPDVVFYSYEPNKVHKTGEGKKISGENAYDDALTIARDAGSKAKASRAEAPKVEAKKVKGPEPEPVSDAVALGKFETQAPHAGMPWWREWFGKRFFTSFTAEVGSSKTFGPLRWIGEQSLQDSIAKLDSITGRRIPTSMAGQTRAEMQTYGMFHELGEVYQIGYTKWRQEMGVSSTARMVGEAENKFGSLVADAVRDTYKGKDVNVIQTAEAVRKTLKQLDEHMVKEGLTEKVFDDPNYFPRKILPSHVSNLLHKAELGALDTFVADAIKSGYEKEIARLKLNPKEAEAMRLTPEEAQVIADIYLTNINTRNFAVDYNNNGFLGDNSALVLGEYLDKLGIKPEVREQILKKTKVTKEATSERFLQHRLLLDEGHMAEVLGKDGQLFTVKMTDFFDNNAKRVMNSHIRQVHGAIQSRKIGLKFNEIRGLSNAEHPRPATWREMGDFIQRTAIKEGRSPVEIQNMADQMRRMRDAVGGFTTEKTSELSIMARMMQKFAGATYGGSFGLAAIAEMGQPMAHTSIKAFMAHIGELPKIVNDFRTGKISGELQKELAMLTGVGTEGRFFREVSTMLEHHPLGTGEQMSKFETVVGNLQNGAFKIGLLTSIDAIQRQYAGMLFAQEMLNGALKGQSSYSATRLAQIGLSPEMTTTIFKYIKKHAKFEGKGNNKLHSFNFKDWAGAEGRDAAAAIQDAIVLHTKKTIHQTHVGQLPRIMQNPLGRLLMQFRNFTIGSYETQLLSNLQAADARAVTSMTTNTFFGLLSYLAIIHVKYGGKQEMLDKYLTPSELAKGAFFRSGYATHLPAVIDTMYQFAGEQAPFNHGRSSGLATGFLSFDSTPVGSLVDGVFGVGKGILASTFNDDYKYSEQDYRKIRKLIPYQNAIGFAYLHGKIGEAFPEKSKE